MPLSFLNASTAEALVHKRASLTAKRAVGQNRVIGFIWDVVCKACAVLIISSCQLATAADLPQTFSDLVPDAGDPLNQPPVLQTNKVLPVDSAFALQSFIEAGTGIVLRWEMPEGYYLYRKSLVVEKAGETADSSPLNLELPPAETITDEFFGEVAIYRDNLLVRLPFAELDAKPGTTVDLLLTYQGCAEALYCYPPEQKALTLKLPE
jgi:thiol:disulfide interchange protein